MTEHAPTTNDDAEERPARSTPARAILASEELEALLGPGSGATSVATGSENQFLRQSEEAIVELSQAGRQSALPTDVRSFSLKEFGTTSQGIDLTSLGGHGDAQLELRVELGRTYMSLEETRRLRNGSVVSFDNSADEPVAIYVNNRLIARGELLVMNGTFCVRVLELVAATLAKAG